MVQYKLSLPYIEVFFRSVMCGCLMYIAVSFTNNKTDFLLTVLCVAGFIIGKCEHIIADIGYIFKNATMVQIVEHSISTEGCLEGQESWSYAIWNWVGKVNIIKFGGERYSPNNMISSIIEPASRPPKIIKQKFYYRKYSSRL